MEIETTVLSSIISKRSSPGSIWIDLDNSPHVPFFHPIVNELHERGYQTMITVRDYAQTRELANLFHLDYQLIGRHYGKNKIMKIAGLIWRSLEMLPTVVRKKPAIALSHGARSQMLLAGVLHIPSVLIADYEHSRHLPFLNPSMIIVPEVIPDSAIHLKTGRIRKYPGIKEDVYISQFTPNPGILEELGLSKKDVIVTVRPPASEAHYHNPKSDELFESVVQYLCRKEGVRIVVLPRDKKQDRSLRSVWWKSFDEGKIIIPKRAVNGLDLIWCSDLVISGGGTMNREAAALGVPVYSIFCGQIGAVDRYLADHGRLVLLKEEADFEKRIELVHRDIDSGKGFVGKEALVKIVNETISLL